MIRISRNTDLIIIHDLMSDVNTVTGIGNISAISTSRIMKIMAIKKNRDEKGSRAELMGSDCIRMEIISRSSSIFFGINVVNIITAGDNKMVIMAGFVIIINPVVADFLIGSQVHLSRSNINH